jgi:glyoxylase-like metal-dependent hydrolase (beta-lactamase superfamily II)
MPLIPLEDSFTDVLQKAQIGRRINDERLAAMAGVSMEDLKAAKEGKPLIAVVRRISRHLRLNPDAMEALVRRGWYPKQTLFPRGFSMFNTRCGDMTVNSYLVWDSRSKEAAAFDTGADSGEMIDFIQSEGLRLNFILITHSHPDHLGGLEKLVAATKASVWSSDREPLAFPGARTFKEHAYFHMGTVAIKTFLTCGHSPGLTTFFVTGLSWPLAIVGDSLFAGSIGGSETGFEEQYKNDREKIFSLPKDTVIAPGHGPMTTLAEEKEHNPFFAGN